MYNKSNLGKLKKMDSLAPEVMKAFWAFDRAALAAGAIPAKYKELIAVAVAETTQCPYCTISMLPMGKVRDRCGAVEAAMVAGTPQAEQSRQYASD